MIQGVPLKSLGFRVSEAYEPYSKRGCYVGFRVWGGFRFLGLGFGGVRVWGLGESGLFVQIR